MSDLLSIGGSGVRAYQTAMNIVGQNIANANTDGYVRRDARLEELAPGAGRYVLQINRIVNGGVQANGVDRQADAFRDAAVRSGTAELGRTSAGIVWLERIERTLDGADISAALTRFFNAAEGIAADPTGNAPRATFLDAAESVATAFRTASEGLAATAEDLEATARLAVTELNGIAQGLAAANAGLSRVRIGTNEHAQLLDERDRLLDRLSNLAAIHVTTDDAGVATVRFNDHNGPVLVEGPKAKSLDVGINASGMLALTLDPAGTPQAVALRGGGLAGLSDSSLRIADMRAELSNLVEALKTGVNDVQAAGIDLDGQLGAAIFGGAVGELVLNPISGRQVAAARPWTVSPGLTNGGAGMLTASTAGGALAATRISVAGGVLTAIDPITNSVIGSAPYTPGVPVTLAGLQLTVTGAPADGDSFTVAATAAASRDNGNLASLQGLRRSIGFETRASEMVSINASALQAKRNVADAQTAILDGATASRDAISGVNLDNEAVELMRFQQAYQASSRIIQVSREIFQSLIEAV